MKSFTASLLVAFGLTLGAANAFAETRTAPVDHASIARSALQEAREHDAKAQQFRVTARAEEQAAKDSMKIAIADEQKGFPYEASVQRGFAAKHQAAAQAALLGASREEAMAAACRTRAAQAAITVHVPALTNVGAAAKLPTPSR